MIVSAEVTINGSKGTVWAVMTDIANASQILSGVEKIEIVEKPATGLVGLKWKETRMLFGKQATVEKWITEAKENAFYKTRAEDGGFVFLTTNRISEASGGVTLTGIHETQPQGFAARLKSLPMVFFEGVIKKAILQDLNDIKAAVMNRPRPNTVEELLAQLDVVPITTGQSIELWIPQHLTLHGQNVAADVAMAVILDKILRIGYEPDGFTEAEGGRVYRYRVMT